MLRVGLNRKAAIIDRLSHSRALSGAPLCAGSERSLGSHHAIALGDPRVAWSDP